MADRHGGPKIDHLMDLGATFCLVTSLSLLAPGNYYGRGKARRARDMQPSIDSDIKYVVLIFL
jgi:hypothetical protein